MIGARYGATRIDDAFLYGFLRERLQEYYPRLESGSGMPGTERHGRGAHVVLSQNLQTLLNRFQPIKHGFAGKPPAGQPDAGDFLDLVDGIGLPTDDREKGIRDGQLHISR